MSGAYPSTLDVLRQALAALELKWTQDTFHTDSRGDVTGCAIDAVRAHIERMTPSPELLEAVRQASAAGQLFTEHNGEVAFINKGEAEDRYAEHEALSCPYCGGSGHKDDAKAPPGWALVPIEPTPGMIRATGALEPGGKVERIHRDAWARMLAAAPENPTA